MCEKEELCSFGLACLEIDLEMLHTQMQNPMEYGFLLYFLDQLMALLYSDQCSFPVSRRFTATFKFFVLIERIKKTTGRRRIGPVP